MLIFYQAIIYSFKEVERVTTTTFPLIQQYFWYVSAELVVDKAMELKYTGGIYGGNIKPTPFLCLLLKMLQIQPEKDIIIEFIKNEDFK